MSSLMPGQALAYAEPCHLGGSKERQDPPSRRGTAQGPRGPWVLAFASACSCDGQVSPLESQSMVPQDQ